MKRILTGLGLGGAILIGALALSGGSIPGFRASAAGGQLLAYDNPKVVSLGQAVYAENCASCHGADLRGQGNWRERDSDGYLPAPPHDASGHTWHHPDEQLIDLTTRGTAAVVGGGYESRMPGFGDLLSEEEIKASLAYIKSTWPAEIIETHNEINQRFADQ